MADPYSLIALVNGCRQSVDIRSPVDEPTLLRLARMTYTPGGGVYVCHHVPADPEGRDFYALFRKQNPGATAYVGYTVFETDSIPEPWIETCNEMDAIWVPSRFNVETFSKAGVRREKLHVIPHGFDGEAYQPSQTRALEIGKKKGFNFLSIFEWTHRKGWDVLIKAFLQEFSKEEDVRLILRAYQGGGVIGAAKQPVLEQLTDYILRLGYDPEEIPQVDFIDYMVPSEQMPGLYKAADAFVLPTRGEGWGIPFTESMLMEVPVIATRWSGHLEFMNDDNSYLIDVDRIVPVGESQVKDSPFYAGHNWADPSVDHTRQLMRRVFEQRKEAKEKGRAARADILKGFTIHHAAVKIASCVMSLEDRRQRRNPRPLEEKQQGTNVAEALSGVDGKSDLRKILFCVRPSLVYDPRDDTQWVLQLKAMLESAGLQVDLTSHFDQELDDYDLVHIFCMDDTFAYNAAARRKPFVVTPNRWSSSLYDTESMRFVSLFKDLLNSRDFNAFAADLADLENRPVQDVPFELDLIYTLAEVVFVSGFSEWKTLAHAFPGIRRTEVLPLGFNRPKDLHRVSPDLFIDEFGVKDFVLSVGPLEPLRNQLMLLTALRDEEVPFVFVEGDASQADYKKLCKGFRRKGPTLFTGEISDEMRASAYRAARVHAAVGWGDMPGTATLEAGWLGCNLVASSSGTTRDCLKDHVHYCDPSDPDSVRGAVLEALKHPADPGLPGFLEKYSWRNQAEEYLRIYREIIRDCRRANGAMKLDRKARAARDEMVYREWRKRAYEASQSKAHAEEGLRLGQELSRQRPKDTLVWFIMGSCCLMMKKYNEAEAYFKHCVDLKPAFNPKAYLCLSLARLKQGKHEEAMDTVLECQELHPLAPGETRELMYDYLRRSSKGMKKDLSGMKKSAGDVRFDGLARVGATSAQAPGTKGN